VIPISQKLAGGLREWRKESGDRVVELSEIGIFELVRKYGELIGVSLAPHDCRRTYAMIGYMSNVPLEQISKLLGHSNVKTTMNYLNIKLDLETTISDFVSLGGD
jgi:integrase